MGCGEVLRVGGVGFDLHCRLIECRRRLGSALAVSGRHSPRRVCSQTGWVPVGATGRCPAFSAVQVPDALAAQPVSRRTLLYVARRMCDEEFLGRHQGGRHAAPEPSTCLRKSTTSPSSHGVVCRRSAVTRAVMFSLEALAPRRPPAARSAATAPYRMTALAVL
jgi:hypothetical protein